MTLNPVCENVETAQGVPLTVTGVAQVTLVFFIPLKSTWIELFTFGLHQMVVKLSIEFKQRDEIHQLDSSVMLSQYWNFLTLNEMTWESSVFKMLLFVFENIFFSGENNEEPGIATHS